MVKTGGNIQLKGGCYPVALYIGTYSVIRMFVSLLSFVGLSIVKRVADGQAVQ